MQPRRDVQRVARQAYPAGPAHDYLALEEPLSLTLRHGEQRLPIASILRTPGQDFELAAGYLYSLGLLQHRNQFSELTFCGAGPDFNALQIVFREPWPAHADQARRVDLVHSGCGACGDNRLRLPQPLPVEPLQSEPDPAWVTRLPGRLRKRQRLFERCGGVHGALALNDQDQELACFEDVGRHNAVDKVVGALLLQGALPARGCWLVLSGRAGWELVHKAARAGFAAVASVGAPTSSALQVAQSSGLALFGFVSERRFNRYN